MTALRSLLFNIFFFGWTMLAPILFAPLFLLSSKASLSSGAPWANGVLWLLKICCGIRHEIRGAQHISDTPVIYASKHQSAWETVAFLTLLKHPAYVLKRELLRIPLWGWYLWRMKMIAIDRAAGASSLKKMVKQAKAAVADGRPIVIFPEGTRTRPGSTARYHPGTAALYGFLRLPVVPVALNSGLYWGKNSFLKRPGKIVVEFLPPIPAGLPNEEFSARLQQTIETASQRLLEDATRD